MPSPLRLLQSALTSLRYQRLAWFDRDYREAQQWCRRGFSASKGELESMQMQRLRERIAGYRALGLCQGAEFDPPSLQHWSDLARIPVLTRTRMQELWPLLTAALAGQDVRELRTTGSTGAKVRFYRNAGLEHTNEGFYIELAKMAGYSPGMTHIVIWANEEATGMRRSYFGRFSRLLYPRLVFRGYTTTTAEFMRIHDAIMHNPGCCVSGYSGMLAACAAEMLQRGLSVPPGHVACLISGAEMLHPRQREAVERAFGTQVHDMYGSREVHQAAWECRHRVLHVNPRLVPEVVDEAKLTPLPEGAAGLLLFTELFNTATPFIRYQIGDYGAVRWVDDCPCGRHGFALTALEGRCSDVVRLVDGTIASPMLINRLLFTYEKITHYQLIRHSAERFTLRYCGTELTAAEAQEIHARLQRALSGSELTLEHSTELLLGPGGKLSYYLDLSGKE